MSAANQPKMVILAGPPGSGKSTAFPAAAFGLRGFNADDRAAQLNGGSYHGIPSAIRAQVSAELEQFVAECIGTGEGFAIETTLRTLIAFNRKQQRKLVSIEK